MDDSRPRKRVAVILAGAVVQGAFEAGVLATLAERDVQVTRIVATSAGALNGVAYAAAVRAGRERAGARQLVELWANEANLRDVFHARPSQWWPFRGVSDQRKLIALLERYAPVGERCVAPINLRMIVTPLRGTAGTISAPGDATTYERMREFDERAFETAAARRPVIATAVASAAFPGAFAPVDLGPDWGPCVDGGSTNNTPIKHALDGAIGDALDAIVVVATTMQSVPRSAEYPHGIGLVGQLADILLNERLYRDLHDAEDTNRKIAQLARLGLGDRALAQVMATLGWKRTIEIVQIRPLEPLAGDWFSGFWHPRQRQANIQIGRERAIAELAEHGL